MPQVSVAALVLRPAFVFALESADRVPVERDKILLSVAGFINFSYFHISKTH